MVLLHDEPFGVSNERAALDYRIRVEADGYAAAEFWFCEDLTEGKVGVSCSVPEGLQLRKGLPSSCYRLTLKPVSGSE